MNIIFCFKLAFIFLRCEDYYCRINETYLFIEFCATENKRAS